MSREWGAIQISLKPPKDAPHEATLLRLDCTKARSELFWHGTWSPAETFAHTAGWYRDFYRAGKINTEQDLNDYINSAEKENLEWTK